MGIWIFPHTIPQAATLENLRPETAFERLLLTISPREVEVLRSMQGESYREFLDSAYWHVVARYVRWQRKVCEDCGRNGKLYVHHKSYDHHGQEHLHLVDLKVLCLGCHDTEHTKTEGLLAVCKNLIESHRAEKGWKPVVNKNYDPRVMMDLLAAQRSQKGRMA
jgi:hypothetical protein